MRTVRRRDVALTALVAAGAVTGLTACSPPRHPPRHRSGDRTAPPSSAELAPPQAPPMPHHPTQDPGETPHPSGVVLRIGVGDSIEAVEARLGPPMSRRPLRNDDPARMGAAVVEYGVTEPVLRFVNETPPAGGPARFVLVVTDPEGRILRVLRNPNAPGPEGMRTLRGPAGTAQAVLIPEDARRVAPSDDAGDQNR
ncbi:hypothetical protein F1188_17365 [Roseospira marina]|uniref:Lipoprotein n=1 Tax=Roseospira marina TaxID=140057 RepID=A0A5M6I7B5_9PROT|nr:hypothetical protein [Roseospira marina]KAA5604151.1 hypothetical protein F1188_17365 [Roseospira marina]MBB4315752.1 hypothetical protein [Roseospira marina]MBB5088919.1 hypothetical protein [Roseospira marina]